MVTIIGVRFRKSGKVYYFGPAGFQIKKGDHVIVETIRGIEYGLVVLAPKAIPEEKIVSPLKDVIRVATPADAETSKENEKLEAEAYVICQEKIKKHGLKMKLIDSEYTFDKNKLLFYFTADGRIDFRELVKDLASVFRTRIELRQIGVRDETKMLGALGICGRPLCCHTFLSDFAPVSIKMAKEQNLSLNPAKISGMCGRLMCCLKNEEEVYEYLNSTLPHIGMSVKTYDGYEGEVQSVSVLKQLVKVLILNENDEKEVKEYSVKELQFDNRKNHYDTPVGMVLPDEELDEEAIYELEKMELSDLEDAAENTEEDQEKEPKKRHNHHRNEKDRRFKGNRSFSNGSYKEKKNETGRRESKSEGNRSEGNRSEGNRSEGHRFEGHRSEGHRPEGHKPEGHKQEGHKSESHKASYRNNSRNVRKGNRGGFKGK